jgi:hypothetical protein
MDHRSNWYHKLTLAGITRSVKLVVMKAFAVLSITGKGTHCTSHANMSETQSNRYDMDFSGSAYSTSAFIRDITLSLT